MPRMGKQPQSSLTDKHITVCTALEQRKMTSSFSEILATAFPPSLLLYFCKLINLCSKTVVKFHISDSNYEV